MKLTKEHIGKKVRHTGWWDETWATLLAIHSTNVWVQRMNGDHSILNADSRWELYEEPNFDSEYWCDIREGDKIMKAIKKECERQTSVPKEFHEDGCMCEKCDEKPVWEGNRVVGVDMESFHIGFEKGFSVAEMKYKREQDDKPPIVLDRTSIHVMYHELEGTGNTSYITRKYDFVEYEQDDNVQKMKDALQYVYNCLGPEPPKCGCEGCEYEMAEALKTVEPFVERVYEQDDKPPITELEKIIISALKDDYFGDHSSGCWQNDARKLLNIKYNKDLFGEDCEEPDQELE